MTDTSLRDFLSDYSVSASAPCRVDCGGHWDLLALSLTHHSVQPCTVNIAIDLRVHVQLLPYAHGELRVTSAGFADERCRVADAPFNSRLGLIFGIVRFFGFSGVQVKVTSQAPVGSGLGGSGALAGALIAAFSEIVRVRGGRALTRKQIVKLAYLMEVGLSASHTGIQDEAAGVFGGVNRWDWKPFPQPADFRRTELLPAARGMELARRFLLVYSGRSHNSGRLNAQTIKSFMTGRNRADWIRANRLTRELADSLKEEDWRGVVEALRGEVAMRRRIMPQVFTPLTLKLIQSAERGNCAARFAGAGGGGCVWAIGEPDDIAGLRKVWQEALGRQPEARLLNCPPDFAGVRVVVKKKPNPGKNRQP